MNVKVGLKRGSPIGAELQPNGGTHFRVWAPRPKKVEVLLEAGPGAPASVQLERREDGYFAGPVPQAAEGTRYRFRLDGADCFCDPASRGQPEGPFGASQVVDPSRFPTSEMVPYLVDPADPSVFERCKLDLSERKRNHHAYDLHRDLLRFTPHRSGLQCPGSGRHGWGLNKTAHS